MSNFPRTVERLVDRVIRPQKGPQEQFLSTSVDLAGYGGSAGGGKSFALLLDALRGINTPGYNGVIFRRTTEQIKMAGGLWDDSFQIYPFLGGVPNQTMLAWKFPSGAVIRFEHLQYESDRYNYQGAQFAFIGFDELTHFTEDQFFYLLSRNRSTCGVKPWCRATFNPDPESWVKPFFAAWVDPEHENPAESGEVRHFVRDSSGMVEWVDSPQSNSLSVTFVRSRLSDNQILMEKDPGYLVRLMGMPLVDRRRLLDGEWVDVADGDYWKKEWFKYVDSPMECKAWIRFWDFAATEQKPGQDPDYTVGVLLGLTEDGQFCVADVIEARDTPLAIEKLILRTAHLDGTGVPIRWEEEGGSSGKFVTSYLQRKLFLGFNAKGVRPNGSKKDRAKIPSAATEAGNVFLVKRPWNKRFENILCKFPDPKFHDDHVDAFTGAFGELTNRKVYKAA